MGLSNSVSLLSRTLERYESDGGQVDRVDATITGRDGGEELNATVDIAVPLCSTETERTGAETMPEVATLAEDGALRLEFPPSIVPEIDQYAPDGVASEREDAHIAADGTVLVTFSLVFEAHAESETAETEAPKSTDPHPEFDDDTETTIAYTESDERDRDGSASAVRSTGCVDESNLSPSAGGEDGDGTDSIAEPDRETDAETESETSLDPETRCALEAARNVDVPPYEDDEYLQCLYDSFDTFTAMADALEMDVASETVRRYMIDAGIHEPSSYDTTAPDCDDEQGADRDRADGTDRSAEEPDGPPSVENRDGSSNEIESDADRPNEVDDPIDGIPDKQLVADGIGLPEGVEIEELMAAIESSMTLYDVQRKLGLDHGQTRELLEQLNLINLVVRRVYDSDDPERPPSRSEIADRIRESVASE